MTPPSAALLFEWSEFTGFHRLFENHRIGMTFHKYPLHDFRFHRWYVHGDDMSRFENIFGYEYAAQPDPSGSYYGRPVRLPAPRFIFAGLFLTLSKNNTVNQLPNL